MRNSSKNHLNYQQKYSDNSFIARYSNHQYFLTISRLLAKIRVNSILDAGCGEGVVLKYICKDIQPKGIVAGFDLDMRRVNLARKNLIQSNIDEVNLMVANLHKIPFEIRTFDLTICLETLEHVGDPEMALFEIKRVTKQYALFSVPNEPWWRIGNVARGKYWKTLGNTPGHINHWTKHQFHNFIGKQFTIIDTASPVLWNFILCKNE
jgi:ubiquinone/menaquinone biosynthesis C-methylase UbiE